MSLYLCSERNDSLSEYLKFLKNLSLKVMENTKKDSPFIFGSVEKDYDLKLDARHLKEEGLYGDALLDELAKYFHGAIRWHSPYAYYNVKSPINIYGAAAGAFSSLYDVNLANDKICGELASVEMEVIRYLGDVAGYRLSEVGGYFTFGGTSTLLNAIKLGLNRAIPDITSKGLTQKVFVVCSEREHPSIIKCCNWLGIGADNCVKIPTDENNQFDIAFAEKEIKKRLYDNEKLVAIVACGGSTLENIIDPIYEIYCMKERISKEFNLDYSPYLHVDAVVGWPILFFKNYSFEKNPLCISKHTLNVIYDFYQKIKEIEYADSFGADFHKTGFCAFSSSVFVIKKRKEFEKLGLKEKSFKYFGEYSPCDYVLETSRSVSGGFSALTVLKSLGKNGLRSEVVKIIDTNHYMRNLLKKLDGFEVINDETFGINILFIVRPQGSRDVYKELSQMKVTDAYRLAKYNYEFYLFCLQNISNSSLFFNYSSVINKGQNRWQSMGVLRLQSFSPNITNEHSRCLVSKLKALKEEYDKSEKKIDKQKLPFVPHEMKFDYKIRKEN